MSTTKRRALPTAQRTFALAYLANGFNGSAAYKTAYPKVDDATARTNAWRLLTNADVRAFLKPKLDAHWKSLQMEGEEALARMALLATVDLGECFTEDQTLRPLEDWPPLLRQCIESIDLEKHRVKIGSRFQALRTILEVTGKVKNPTAGDALRDLAEILAEKWKG